MWRSVAVVLLTAAVFGQTAPSPPPSPLGIRSVEQELMEADRKFAQSTLQRRAEGWMEYMADNAVILRAAPLVGKDAIREAYTRIFADPSFTLAWEPTKAEVFPPYNLGYTIGKFTSSHRTPQCGGRGSVASRGTYLTTWQKQKDGSWKVIADVGAVESNIGTTCTP